MQSMLTMERIENQEQEKQGQESQQADFEELLEEYSYKRPKRGQILEGEIKLIDEDSIVLDVGLKRDAVVLSRELNKLEDEFFEELSIGDVIPISISRTPVGDEDLLASIEDAFEYQNWEEVKQLMNGNETIELKVVGKNKGGLLVQFELLEGFVPNSHIPGLKRYRDRSALGERKNELVGEELTVKPIEVKPKQQRLVFSGRLAEKAIRKERLEEIQEGEVMTGTVVNLVDFGAFVDLGGIDGLVHLSELDWKRVKHPSDVIDIGEEIDVLIMDVDIERGRIQLSRKALLPDPWERVEENYVPGDLVEVKIMSVVDFGAFGQLSEGVQGLIHVSELGYTSPVDSRSTVEPGDEVLVKILRIDKSRERISLSMRKVPLEKQLDWALEKELEDDAVPQEVAAEQASAEEAPEEQASESDQAQTQGEKDTEEGTGGSELDAKAVVAGEEAQESGTAEPEATEEAPVEAVVEEEEAPEGEEGSQPADVEAEATKA